MRPSDRPARTRVRGTTWESLVRLVRKLPRRPLTDQERADWAYGNAVLSNPEVTRDMADRAVREAKREAIVKVPERLADASSGEKPAEVALGTKVL